MYFTGLNNPSSSSSKRQPLPESLAPQACTDFVANARSSSSSSSGKSLAGRFEKARTT